MEHLKSCLQRGDRAACREIANHFQVQHGAAPYIQHDVNPGNPIRETESGGVNLNPSSLGPQEGRQDGHRRAPYFPRLGRNQVQFPEQASNLVTARRSLTVLPDELMLNAPITIGWICQRDVTHLITVRFTPCLTNFHSSGVSSGVTQLPVRHFNVSGKAGQADIGLVLEHLGVECEGLLNAQRPRAFFAM